MAKGYNVDSEIKSWQRYEIQLRAKRATQVLKILAYDNYQLGEFIKGVLKANINYRIPSKTDSNKRRWNSCKWWLKFLDDADEITFSQIQPEPTIESSKRWLERQVTSTLATMEMAFGSQFIINYLLVHGKERLTEKQKQRANMFFNDMSAQRLVLDEIKRELGDLEFVKLIFSMDEKKRTHLNRISVNS
ncbi:replication initiation factor domain-containing protein [Periweissella fabalis]|nr:replication initiation factor domain-containing protein [Periweissella fabalis]